MTFKSKLYFTIAILGVLTVMTVGCAETEPAPSSGLEDTKWRLESYGEQGNLQAVLAGTKVTATFDSTKGQAQGSAGCNTYFADYKVNNNKLSILQIANTEMYCLEPEGVMEQEQQYLKALQAAESFQVQDAKLQITSGNQILIYTSYTSD